ncbi:hypothetical protein PV04_04281 [Phialophora macrospora]|uniref:Uncharacterized protein n=1 Tax=Phialophora macrospora TaxID=1851006 RepID=A0A0D2FJN4_9EURO|nr:hypothetical protein PV04_04281 [Phialophora macrospora]
MAQPAQPFFHICRTCRQSLRGSSWSKPVRSFSTTPAKRKVIPSFSPTSSPEFDELLLTWRNKVFMPAAVESHHRDLMYKTSQQPTLVNEPGVTVTMDDGEEIKLEPRHAFDKPNMQKSLKQLAKFLDGNDSDTYWSNLLPFLKGLVSAQLKLPGTYASKLARKACEVGKEHIIISAAAKPKEMGISLRQHDVARELMLGLHNHAVLAGFEGPELETISRRAEHVARMLEDQLHTGDKLREGECDARKDPVVLAVLLELAAERALHRYDGKDEDGQVANYATKLLYLEGRKPVPGLESSPAHEQNHALVQLIPIQNSIKWALEVDSVRNSRFANQLNSELKNLTELMDILARNLRAAVGDKPRRGLQMYNQLNGKPTDALSSTPSASPA